MSPQDSIILLGLGGFFVVLGLVALFWGRREEKRYYDSIAERHDAREFLEHWPRRPEPGATKVGGWISFALGAILLIIGGVFFQVG